LLPDLEQQSLFDEYARGTTPIPSAYCEIYVCPSDGAKSRSGSVMSYVANAGKAGSAAAQKPRNGPFLNRMYLPDGKFLEGHWTDGREYTLISTENVDAMNYDVIGWNGLGANANDTTASPIDSDIMDKGQDTVWSPAFVWQTSPEKSSLIN